MKAKARTTPHEHAFQAAQMYAIRFWLTTAPLSLDEPAMAAISEVQDVLQAAQGKRSNRRKELEALVPAEQRDEFSDRVGEAVFDAHAAGYLVGLAYGLLLGRGGQPIVS